MFSHKQLKDKMNSQLSRKRLSRLCVTWYCVMFSQCVTHSYSRGAFFFFLLTIKGLVSFPISLIWIKKRNLYSGGTLFLRLPLFRLKSKTGRSVVRILETHEESRLLVTRLRSDIRISVKFISLFFSFFFCLI